MLKDKNEIVTNTNAFNFSFLFISVIYYGFKTNQCQCIKPRNMG